MNPVTSMSGNTSGKQEEARRAEQEREEAQREEFIILLQKRPDMWPTIRRMLAQAEAAEAGAEP